MDNNIDYSFIHNDNNLINLIKDWLKWDFNLTNKNEILDLIYNKNEKELRKRLLNRIDFGTAGLRGPMKSGFSNINSLTILQASQVFFLNFYFILFYLQGLASYVNLTINDAKEKGICF